MHAFDILARTAFALAGAALMLLALGLIFVAGYQVTQANWPPDAGTGRVLLDGVGYTIIAIAVFDVGKYLIEEEAIRGREMRQAGEARQSMTKFITTIAIAIFLEALVTVFDAGKQDIATMLYPTLLLLAGVALVVGLGVYQRLSARVEITAEEPPDPRNRNLGERKPRLGSIPQHSEKTMRLTSLLLVPSGPDAARGPRRRAAETLAGSALGHGGCGQARARHQLRADGKVAGTGGCNRFFGSYEQKGEALTFSPLGSTRMACPPDMMRREQAFFEMLGEVRSANIEGTKLALRDAAGQELAKLSRRDGQ